jgi:hypothetical protein
MELVGLGERTGTGGVVQMSLWKKKRSGKRKEQLQKLGLFDALPNTVARSSPSSNFRDERLWIEFVRSTPTPPPHTRKKATSINPHSLSSSPGQFYALIMI